mmetsp:Transcript_14889/g.19737  ORF Transcript_14889/g.19737 Transcript_14889/m.19737 type:complete len:229 (+) Transcript_14889:548-1234(+)
MSGWAVDFFKKKKNERNSSGLHHDFHDNLLLLLSGRKLFRCWDPTITSIAKPTGGQPLRIYANGRIVYKATPSVLADGRDSVSAKAQTISSRLDHTDDEDELERLLDAALDTENAHRDQSFDTKSDPANFATIPRAHSPKDSNVYPDLRHLPSLASFVLKPGDALYLPCGWWHEVTSFNGFHAAWNYWFHPPTTSSFSRPYDSPFWQADWNLRCQGDNSILSSFLVDD